MFLNVHSGGLVFFCASEKDAVWTERVVKKKNLYPPKLYDVERQWFNTKGKYHVHDREKDAYNSVQFS